MAYEIKELGSFSEIKFDLRNQDELAEYEQQQLLIQKTNQFERYKASGVPEKFWNESLDTFKIETEEEKQAFETVKNFASDPKNKVLLLCGKNGNGKTHLAASVLKMCNGEYITSSMLCMKYDSAIGFKAKMSREEVIEHYINVTPVLVIDECCKYFLNQDLEKFILTTITCGRYENNKATVLVGNPNKKPFLEFLGTAVFDRFTEVCTTLEFTSNSKRKSLRASD